MFWDGCRSYIACMCPRLYWTSTTTCFSTLDGTLSCRYHTTFERNLHGCEFTRTAVNYQGCPTVDLGNWIRLRSWPPSQTLDDDFEPMVGRMTEPLKQPCLVGDLGRKWLSIGDWISSFMPSKVSWLSAIEQASKNLDSMNGSLHSVSSSSLENISEIHYKCNWVRDTGIYFSFDSRTFKPSSRST